MWFYLRTSKSAQIASIFKTITIDFSVGNNFTVVSKPNIQVNGSTVEVHCGTSQCGATLCYGICNVVQGVH